MTSRTWVDDFREIEKVMLFIKSGNFKSALKKPIHSLNKNYTKNTHEYHVNALNFGLKKYFQPRKKLNLDDINPNLSLKDLRTHLRNNFIATQPKWLYEFQWIEEDYIPIKDYPYEYAENIALIDINTDYLQNHTIHVMALNKELSPYMQAGSVIPDGIFNEKFTVLELRDLLDDQFIKYPNGV